MATTNKAIKVLSPELKTHRVEFTELLTVKSQVEKSTEMLNQLESLRSRKNKLERIVPEKVTKDLQSTSLPTKALYELSQIVKDLLINWKLPNSGEGDFVISGKHRVSNGKGYRAITHAAATLGLMKHAESFQMHHIGFVLLDSPLLAYEEPEDDDDDLSGTDVNIHFFDYLATWDTRQIIVMENKKSIPAKYDNGKQVTHFTKSSTGRYGYFPT